ncbi:hypothetical protein DM800_20130 [Bacillus sp. AY18-3]|uniref:hypothetical protein n=1 Tax=Bacillus sp. AY18-3 TaxID=2217814 RepID=UPI0011C8714D|nr:hypothetical protein [Bacillus sp. AY18-3]TXR62591.1 hypothetical protein DM800_20130 [Bacillus sp. AY18-3]
MSEFKQEDNEYGGLRFLMYIPTIIFFIWSIYYCICLLNNTRAFGVSSLAMFILGLLTLCNGVYGIFLSTRKDIDGIEFFMEGLKGLLAIGCVIILSKIPYFAEVFIGFITS